MIQGRTGSEEFMKKTQEHKPYTAIEQTSSPDGPYRCYFDNAPCGIYVMDHECRLVDVNLAITKITGYSKDELLKMHAYDLAPPIEPSAYFDSTHSFIETGIQCEEIGILTKTGELLWVAIEGVKLSEDRFLCSMKDITISKPAELYSNERDKELKLMIGESPTVFAYADSDLKYRHVNNQYLEYFRLQKADVIGKPIGANSGLPNIPLVKANLSKALSGKRVSCELSVPSLLEGPRWLNFTFIPDHDNKGKVRGIFLIAKDITKPKNLLTSEGRLGQVMEATDNALWEWNYTTGKGYFSSRYYTMLGYAPGEFSATYDSTKELIHPHDLDTVYTIPKHIQENKGSFSHEYRMRKKSGEWAWVLNRGKVVKCDAEGRALRAVGTLKDITERKLAEDALLESEARYRSYVDNAPHGVFLIDREGRYLDANPATEQITGFSRDELLQKTIYEILDEKASVIQQIIKETIDAGSLQIGVSFTRADGELRWCDIEAIKLNENELLGFVTDTTERKQAEDALRESQHFTQSVIDTTPDLVYVYDIKEHRNVYTNEEMASVLGYTQEEIIQEERLFELILHPDDAAIFAEHHNKLKLADDGMLELEYRMMGSKGQWRWLYSRDKVFSRDEDGTVRQIIGTTSDITERKQAEEALRDSNRQLRALSRQLLQVQESERRKIARDLHDEIGAMATALSISLSLSREASGEIIKRNIEQAIEIAGDLTARVRDISLDLRPSMLDDLGLERALNWYFERYISRTQIQVEFRHRGLDKRFPAELETAAYRIIQEAATNTARYANVNKIYVVVYGGKHQLKFKIIDRGVGFDTEAVLRKARTGGIIGISERASLLGGKVVLKSKPGQGTNISVSLPILNAEIQ